MARIPRYQSQGQIQGAPDAGFSPNATAGSFGAGNARLLQSFGHGVNQVGQAMIGWAKEKKAAETASKISAARIEAWDAWKEAQTFQGEKAATTPMG